MHLIVSRDHKDPKTCLDNMITSRKLEKEFKFHRKIANSGVITKVITILLTSYKSDKHPIKKKMLKFVIIKS